jgi:hypothetical protein
MPGGSYASVFYELVLEWVGLSGAHTQRGAHPTLNKHAVPPSALPGQSKPQPNVLKQVAPASAGLSPLALAQAALVIAVLGSRAFGSLRRGRTASRARELLL